VGGVVGRKEGEEGEREMLADEEWQQPDHVCRRTIVDLLSAMCDHLP